MNSTTIPKLSKLTYLLPLRYVSDKGPRLKFIKMRAILSQTFLFEMTSITANVRYTVEQRGHLPNPHHPSSGSDPLYLQFKPTLWALTYPRKHARCGSRAGDWGGRPPWNLRKKFYPPCFCAIR